ncbi:YIP1 family protein [Sagittula salina]|uniref:YIP1 family protein n=1 Tax=Sagittula salina TaxID=2820268 RepID=A0A940MND6_9RHOB|nr:YIP1 family protein [Sagittula salina]MBP0481831.1 YIP1 family protein [Sagittula salina]
MAVSSDIAAMYRRPAAVVRDKLARVVSEPRALAYLMAACGLMFVAQMPGAVRRVWQRDPASWEADRQAFQEAVQPELGATLLGMVILLPLFFYLLALIIFAVARLFRSSVAGWDVRLVTFWALLAATPLQLLAGLTSAFVGAGTALNLVGVLWVVVFLWFLSTGVREAHRMAAQDGEAA